ADLSGRESRRAIMNAAWKYATIGIAAVGLTAATSSVMTAYVMRPSSPDAAATAQETDSRNDALDVRPTVSERRPSPSAPRRVAASPALNLARVSAQEPSPASSTSPVTAPASPVTAAPATVNENVPLPP